MKKGIHIQTRLLLTLIGMTVTILLLIGLAFNLSVRAYIRSRVTSQLSSVSESASSDRRGGGQGAIEKRPGGRADRITGAMGNAVVLDENGALVTLLRADEDTASVLSAYYQEHGIRIRAQYQVLSTENGTYAVSVSEDPIQKDCYLVSYVDITAVQALTTLVNLVLLIIILVAILLSVILSRRFARSFAVPVQELSAFAHEIGAGQLQEREFKFNDIEFCALADAMNHMVSELNTSRKKQEILFQNVSHELRTPLTSIRGNAEGIVYNVMEPQTAAKTILKESKKLGDMVEDILYLSRMGKSTQEDAAEPVDLRESLSLCVSEQRIAAEDKDVTFSYDFDEDPVWLPMRDQDAQRLFGNLISNAIRYAKGKIHLTCRSQADVVLVSVSDDGPGISEEDLPHIFERFYKGKDGKHGIGLSIVASVVESYHGSVTARNEQGAVFEVRFPVS